LLEREEEKERLRVSGELASGADSSCHATVHNGRDVKVCYCSTDQCNGARTSRVAITAVAAVALVTVAGTL